jgi:hypothetical protein
MREVNAAPLHQLQRETSPNLVPAASLHASHRSGEPRLVTPAMSVLKHVADAQSARW